MSGGIYGGDDIGAIVFDSGSHSFRAGYGGEECPKFDIPAVVGARVDSALGDGTMDVDKAKVTKPERFIGSTKTNYPRASCELDTYMADCMIDNFDLFDSMLEYLYTDCLKTRSSEHGVLFSEATWNTRDKREKLAELMFEKYQVPAFFLAKTAVLTAFSQGRSGGLIIDSGATYTSVTPVYEGYALIKNVVKSPIGGNLIIDQCKRILDEQKIDLVPYYKVASKAEVKENEPPSWTPKTNLPDNLTESYKNFMTNQLVEDFAKSTLQLCDGPIDLEFMDKLPAASYGFPCGFRKDFHAERAKIPEALFDLSYVSGHDKERDTFMDVASVAMTSAGMCDPDVKAQMYSNVIVTGGNSLIMGFMERVGHDLAKRCNHGVKLRVPSIPHNERRYGAWVGGSILSSTGSFQQLWISSSEYKDSGKSIIEKRCM